MTRIWSTGRWEACIPYDYVLQLYNDKQQDRVLIPGTRTYVKPADLLRNTYYNWEQEAARYQELTGRGPVNVHLTVNYNPPADMPDNPSDEKTKTLQNEQIKQEILFQRIRNYAILGAFVALIVAAVLWLEKIQEVLDWIKSLFG